MQHNAEDEGLPLPAVAPDEYDESYFLDCCGGHDEWQQSGGAAGAPVYAVSLDRAQLRPGEVVVDIGTGRGELLADAVAKGASRAIGIEYAQAAVNLARKTLDVRGVTDRAEVLLADARRIPLEDATADLVTMLDVVEHLAPAELDASLREAHRILQPGGRILIHTFPSRTVYDVTYRLQRALHPTRRRTWPRDPRNEFEHRMHVNEQTVTALRRSLRRAGFRPATASLGQWVYTDFVPDEGARKLYGRLASIPPLRRLGIADLWGEGTKPALPR